MLEVVDAQASVANRAIHNPVSLTVSRGEALLLRGGNGSGKTSLLWAIFGLRRMLRGTSRIEGNPVRFRSTWRLSATRTLSLVTQFPNSPPSFTIEEFLAAANENNQTGSFVRTLNELLCPVGKEIHKNTIIRTMSVGQRKAFDLLFGLMRSPVILAADEPFAGLSPMLQSGFVDRMKEYTNKGGSLIVVAHAPEQQRIPFDKAIDISPL